MSRIGSTERTRGIVSKLLTGGGEVVNHSSVLPFHGSGPADTPRLRLPTTLYAVTTTPSARMKEAIVEIRLGTWRTAMYGYSYTHLGMTASQISSVTSNAALN